MLEVVILVGTLLSDENCADIVARSMVVPSLMDMLKAKQEDDEIVLQIVYVWNKLLYYPATRDMIMQHTQAISYLLDLIHDKNAAIRGVVASALDIVAEFSAEWAQQIKTKKFIFHNQQWIEMILDGAAQHPAGYADEYAYADNVVRDRDMRGKFFVSSTYLRHLYIDTLTLTLTHSHTHTPCCSTTSTRFTTQTRLSMTRTMLMRATAGSTLRERRRRTTRARARTHTHTHTEAEQTLSHTTKDMYTYIHTHTELISRQSLRKW